MTLSKFLYCVTGHENANPGHNDRKKNQKYVSYLCEINRLRAEISVLPHELS